VGDAQQLPFASASVDVVLAAHMLYHVPDVERAVEEIARVLRSEGRVVVALNSPEHLHEMFGLLGRSLRGERDTSPLSARSMQRGTLEQVPGLLARSFEVESSERLVKQLEVPIAQPVLDYLDSMRSFYEPRLPSGRTWPDVLDTARVDVESTITHEGSWHD